MIDTLELEIELENYMLEVEEAIDEIMIELENEDVSESTRP